LSRHGNRKSRDVLQPAAGEKLASDQGWIPLSREIFPAKAQGNSSTAARARKDFFRAIRRRRKRIGDDGESPRPVRAERLRVR